MPTVDIDIELVGSADGVPVEITGHGSRDASRLALEVRTARSLLLLDPALIALGLLDVVALAGTQADNPDVDVHVRSRADLYDEHGRDAGGWRVVAALESTGGGLRLAGQLLDHVARIEPGERVVAVDAAWATLAQPVGDEGMLLAGAWNVRTGRGNGYRGVTTALVVGSRARRARQARGAAARPSDPLRFAVVVWSAASEAHDSWDAIVGARLLYRLIGTALASRR